MDREPLMKIMLFIAHQENRRLLAELMAKRYQLLFPDDFPDLERGISQPFDLCIVDGLVLTQHRQQLQARREAETPVFLPILLLTNRDSVKLLTANLWHVVDDVIVTPIEKRELLARVETVLRSRRLSLELKEVKGDLCKFRDRVHTLQQELDNLSSIRERLNSSIIHDL
ncbi:MAG: hypothetical protein AB4352_14965 [Hormoscilla sp.]